MYKIVLALISVATVMSDCGPGDVAIWRSDPSGWNKNFETLASNSFGQKSVAIKKFQLKYPTMTPACVVCQAELVACGMAKCTVECIANRLAPQCRACVESKCLTPYYTCIGTSDESLIPIPPWAL